MARDSRVSMRATLRKRFPSQRLRRWAKECGAVRRFRRVDPAAMFWALVLGFGCGKKRTLSGLRRALERATGRRVEESSFYDRFNPGLVRMLKRAVKHAFDTTESAKRQLDGVLKQFADVLITDSTVLRLHALLEKAYPACRTNHTRAALKAHAMMSVAGAGEQSIKITSERRHDGPVLKIGRWVAGKLMLFDLGFHSHRLFSRIEQNGGYFVARLKKTSNPRIVGVNRGSGSKLVGERLQDVLFSLRRPVLDIEVELDFARRSYAGQRARRDVLRTRVVAVRDEGSHEYHLYVTNVGAAQLAAEQVRSTYALRWQIELLFKELKHHYRLDQLPSRKPHIVEALVFAAILTMIVSRRLLDLIRATARDRLPEHRAAALLTQVAAELLLIIVARASAHVRARDQSLRRWLSFEAIDPNRQRVGLLESVEFCTHRFARQAA